MSNETQDSYPLSQFQPLEAILDPVDNSFRLISTISSANFDGVIPDTIIAYPTATTSDIIPGRHILIGESFCIVTRIYENIDPSTTDTLSYEIYFIENNLEKSKTILSSVNTFTDGTELVVRKDDWDGKSLGESGWTITTEGNSVFSNVAVRGRIEATEGHFDGFLVVGDPENTQTPGSMKIGTGINNVSLSVSADNSDTTLSVSSSTGVFVGMFVLGTGIPPNTRVTNVSPTIITISNATTQALSNISISFINNGLHINTNNYWYDTGLFSIGNGTAGVVWNGSTLAITGQVTATSGTIGGFTIGATSLTAGTESNSVGLAPGTFPFFAGSATPSSAPFRVNTAGQLTATGATITGAITATSGTFTGTVNATGGTFTNVVNIGSGTNKIKLTGGTTDLSTSIEIGSGGFGVAPFYAEGTGKFSLGTGLSWNPATSILNVNGILKGFVAVEAVPVVVNPNSMNFGYFSAVEDIHGTGVGLKIDNNNYWFSNNQFRVGTSGSYFSWDGTTLEASGTIKAGSGNIGGAFGWQIDGSKIFSGSDQTYIALQSSGDSFQVPISSIVIDDEGGGLSSIYILSEIPNGYTLSNVQDLYGSSLSLPSDSGVILNNNNINKLKDYAYPIQEVSFSQWSLSNGDAEEGDPVPQGYVTFIIYGEDNDQTFVDETVSNITEENILVGNLSDNSGIWIGNEIFTLAPFSVNQSGLLKASSGEIGGFSFDEISDEGTGGDFNSLSENFDRGTYSPPYTVQLSPINGIVLNVNKSLNDATAYFIEGTETTYPETSIQYQNILKSTGFTVVDNTGSASNVTINPYMGLRSESVSAINIAKNGSFEYKTGTSQSYSYSGAGWTLDPTIFSVTSVTSSSPTITMTNYIGNNTTTVTGTSASDHGLTSGNIINVSGAVGTQQVKLNGTWTIVSTPTPTTFTFVVTSAPTAGTLTTGLGTTVNRLATYTATGNNLVIGESIVISGSSIAGYNGTFTVRSVATNTFTIANATSGSPTFTNGLVSIQRLTLSSLSATTAGYSFPVLPYGQQFVGNLSWTIAGSEFLNTEFNLDPDGSNESYPSPKDPSIYIPVGADGISSNFAIYNSQPNGLFGTSHYVAAYPIQDLKVTYTDNDGVTQTINPFDSTYIKISDMLQNLIDSSASDATFEDGYLYLSAPYTENILSFPITTNTRQSFTITSKTGDLTGDDDGEATLTIGAHPFAVDDEVSLFFNTTDISGLGDDAYTYTVLSTTSTTITIDTQLDNISSANSVKTSLYTLTIGAHPFYAGKEVALFNGSTDLGEESTFTVLSVTSTQIVVESGGTLLSSANSVKTDGTPVYSLLATRGKNGISFEVSSDEYSDADNSMPYRLQLPAYYYGVTFNSVLSKTATFTRSNDTPSSRIIVPTGIDVVFESLPNLDEDETYPGIAYFATTTGLSNSATTLTFADSIDTGFHDLHKDYSNSSTTIDSYSSSATSIVVYEDKRTYHTLNSFAYIEDSEDSERREYVKITASSYNSDEDVTTLTISRAQLGSTAIPINIDSLIYTIERVNVTNISNNTTSYYNFDQALFDSVDNEVVPIIGEKINNASLAFDELVISDSPIAYFDGDTGGGAEWGVDALQPAIWSYRPSAVIAQLGGNPLVIGTDSGLNLIKQIGYEPYTYLLENPSVIVEQWDSDPSQSSLVISGGKFSITAKEPRIELIAGTSASNNGMVNLDGSKIRLMDSHTGTTGLVIGPWKGTSSTYLSLSPNTYSGNGYGLLFSNNTTFMSSNTGGSTIIRGPNNTEDTEINLTSTEINVKGSISAPRMRTVQFYDGTNYNIPANMTSYLGTGLRTTSGNVLTAAKGVSFTTPISGRVIVIFSGMVSSSQEDVRLTYRIGTGSVINSGTQVIAPAADYNLLYFRGANSYISASNTYMYTLTPNTVYNITAYHYNPSTSTKALYYRTIQVIPVP
jgi:hypothetical protein